MRKILFLLVFVAAAAHSAAAQSRIGEVRIEGNERIEADTILLQVQAHPGGEYSPQAVSSDVKQIYRTGYFDQVAAKTVAQRGATDVVFVVKERPAIRNVLLEGNEEVTDETLKEKLNLGARRFLDRSKIRGSIEQGKQYYQSLGYYDVTIEAEESAAENNQVDLTFKITEGEKKVIREIVFEGNKVVPTSELEDLIKTQDHFWLTSWITGRGILKQEQLEADQKELTHFYLNRGHVDIRVTEPEVVKMEKGLRITFKITEGDVFTIGKLSASGSLIENSQDKTLEGIETKSGDTFNADNLRKDTFTISEKYTDKGFAFANVNPDTAIDREAKTVGINFEINKGNLISVSRINVTGNKKTSDNVVRRSLKIEEQELFSSSKIRRSQELLQRLGYFDEVTITPEPAQEKDKVDLNVAVREANTGTFSIGAGISSGDGFIFNTQITESNVLGTGNSVSLEANTGTRAENFVLSFDNPRVDDTYLSFGVDALSMKRRYDDFDKGQVGGSVSIGYPLWFLGSEYLEDIRGTLQYELTQVDISDVDEEGAQLIQNSEGKTIASTLTPRLVRNTINNPIDPTKGSRQVVSVELAGLGGDQNFWFGSAANTFYYTFWDSPVGPLVFSNRLRFDYGETFNGDDFPLYKRVFLGGINSIRGYSSRRVGPRDANESFYGGSKDMVGNFELILPLVNAIGLKTVFFYDVGNAYDDDENMSLSNTRHAVGFGIRWRSPIAPIRIEFGYPLDKEDGDQGMVTNFTFGNPQ